MISNFNIQKYYIPMGLVSFVLAIVYDRQFGSTPIGDFLSGLFTGLSIVFNLAGAFFCQRKNKAARCVR